MDKKAILGISIYPMVVDTRSGNFRKTFFISCAPPLKKSSSVKGIICFMQRLKIVLLLLFLIFMSTSELHGREDKRPEIVFGAAVQPNQPIYKVIETLFSIAFDELGYRFKLISCVPSNCAQMNSNGSIDGEPARVEQLGLYYPNLIKVDQMIISIELIVIQYSGLKSHKTLESLITSDLRIAYQEDYIFFDHLFKEIEDRSRVRQVSHWKEGLNAVSAKQADVFVALKQVDYPILKEYLGDELIVTEILPENYTIGVFPFMNKKHKELALELETAIEKMKSSGRFKKIMESGGIS